jgi:hypothetical protein
LGIGEVWDFLGEKRIQAGTEYRLEHECEGMLSASPDGSRTIYKDIWSANVPQKVKIFAWRLAQEVLATQLNRTYRKLEENG